MSTVKRIEPDVVVHKMGASSLYLIITGALLDIGAKAGQHVKVVVEDSTITISKPPKKTRQTEEE